MPMKWIPLDGTKEPAFDFKYLLLSDNGDWEPGYLKERKETSKTVEYVWLDTQSNEIMSSITHYMKVEGLKKDFQV